jgi:hypothetical protein
VAESVLYEGYLLYPYRRSSPKNHVRWQFGVVAPASWVEVNVPADSSVAGSVEAACQQTECLLEAPDDAVVHVRVRFLQVQRKRLERTSAGAAYAAVDMLEAAGVRHLSFDEAVPHEHDLVFTVADLLRGECRRAIEVAAGYGVETLHDGNGRELGRLVRSREPLSAAVTVSAERCDTPFRLLRLRVRIENTAVDVPADVGREDALRRALVATHTLVGLDDGAFLSLLDPPEWAAGAAKSCVNVHTFPVLAGGPGTRHVVLSSPIILYDHVQVAPESPGDLHDATEIDEILSLRTMTLTDEEKREARATDPRAAEIIDRVDAMPPELLDRLHGAIRSLRQPAAEEQGDQIPWWHPAAEAGVDPERDEVVVGGVRLSKGSRVRLRPRRRGTDVHDMFLAGRTATVARVLLDVDGSRYVAVTVDDDPAAELHEWYGRFFQFSPDEVEPLRDEVAR